MHRLSSRLIPDPWGFSCVSTRCHRQIPPWTRIHFRRGDRVNPLSTPGFSGLHTGHLEVAGIIWQYQVFPADFLNKKTEILSFLEGEREHYNTQLTYYTALNYFFVSKNELLFATGLIIKLNQTSKSDHIQ